MVFKKYDKIHRLGKEENRDIFLTKQLFVQEKIDGGNFRFYFTEDGTLIFGSRTQQLTSNEGEYTNIPKNFGKVVEFVRTQVSNVPVEKLKEFKDYVFFGEACIKHTLSYNWDEMPLFLGFDIYDNITEKYILPVDAEKIFNILGIQYIQADALTVDEFKKRYIEESYIPKCKYPPKTNPEQLAEGIVVKNYDNQIFAKIVREEFKEENKKIFGGTPKEAKTDDEKLVNTYCTNYRIEKIILKALDNGNELDMKIMGDIIRNTYQDIIEEEWREILNSNWTLNFKNCRKLIANRCRYVLNNMIINNTR